MSSSQVVQQPDWETYRDEIQRLYLTEKWELKKLKSHMEEEYDFHATKAQYEGQFKKWNARKNLTNTDWKYIEDRVKKRKRDGKETIAYFYGTPVPEKKLKKELSRRFPPSFEQLYASAPTPPSPEGVMVGTPPASVSFAIDPGNLPCFQLMDLIKSQIHLNLNIWVQVMEICIASRRQTTLLQPRVEAARRSILAHVQALVPTLPENASKIETTVCSSLHAMCVERYDGELPSKMQEFLGSSSHYNMLRLFHLAVYLVSNNMANEEMVFEWLVANCQHRSLSALLSMKIPAVEAFAIKLFKHALQTRDLQLAQACLDAGVNPNFSLELEVPDSPYEYQSFKPLEYAARNGDVELVKMLLNAGVEVNKTSVNTPYLQPESSINQAAAESGSIKVVQLLSDAGDVIENSALQAAASSGTIEVVQLLLDAGLDVNAPHKRGTALQAAAKNDDLEMLEFLLDRGADINAPASVLAEGRTALQWAVYNDNMDMVKLLLEEGAEVNEPAAWNDNGRKERTALEEAMFNDNMAMVELLLKKGAKVNLEGEGLTVINEAACSDNMEKLDAPGSWEARCTALETAASDNNVELVEMLLERGADVNVPAAEGGGSPALGVATIQGNADVVELLLESGADLDAPVFNGDGIECDRITVLEVAAGNGHVDIVKILLRRGVNVNGKPNRCCGRTALQAAAENDNAEMLEVLLDRGANINAPAAKYGGSTALQLAAGNGNIRLVRYLLSKNADVNAQAASCGRTALQEAFIGPPNVDLVQTLLDAGAHVNAPAAPKGGWTALQGAAIHGHLGIAHMLLEAGADVNAARAEEDGGTALEAAAGYGRLDMVHFLLNAGADTEDDGLKRAADRAAEQEHYSIAKFLRSYHNHY